MMGGGGGGGGQAQQNFLPPGQAEAAGQLPELIGPMRTMGVNALNTIGDTSPAALAYPFVTGTTSNILNNPYQGAAVDSSLNANNIFQGQVSPLAYEGASTLSGLGRMAGGAFGGIPGGTYGNPAYESAGQAGYNMSGGFQGAVSKALGDIFNPSYAAANRMGGAVGPQLGGAASHILDSAFDPERKLYDRTLSQVSDQTNAYLANQGLAGSPYGAGVAGKTLSDFNLDWNDRQLARQTSGGQAAGALDLAGISAILNPAMSGTSAAATDIGAAGGAASSALSSILGPANARTAATLQGTSALGNLSGIANSGFGGATRGLTDLASGTSQFGAAPYGAYNTIQGNNFGALQNEINLGNAAYALPEQVIGDLMQYLGLGQRASSIGAQIAGTNNQIGQTNFGQLASGAQGASSLLFGNQGPFGSGGLLGGSGGGGLGSLFGGGSEAFDAAGNIVPFGSDAVVAAGGGGDFLASAAPLALSV